MRSNKFLQQMKNLLLSQQSLLTNEHKQPHDVDADGDEVDEIQALMIIGVQNKLSNRNNYKLNQINDALKKIDLKTYGLCEDCGEEIPEKRLLANPHFLTCVGCAEDREKEEKQKRR